MDDCNGTMTLGLADVSYMSIFNDFDETDRDVFQGRIMYDFSMITVDSTTGDNHENTLGTGTNDLGNDTGAHKKPVLWPSRGSNCDHESCVEDELLSNCDHESCVDDELLSNCDTKESVDDETNSNCDTKEKVDD